MAVLFSWELVAHFKIAIIHKSRKLFSEYLEFLCLDELISCKEKWVSVWECMTACCSHMMPYSTELMKLKKPRESASELTYIKQGKNTSTYANTRRTERSDRSSTNTKLPPTEPDCLSSSSSTQRILKGLDSLRRWAGRFGGLLSVDHSWLNHC